jgi:hypothetical protein
MVGAGATRRGLGPFLAAFAEQAGGRVVAVAGRSAVRAEANAALLAERLHHPVQASADAAALCAEGIDALLVCSPAEHHLAALQAAVAAGVPVLCEKPLVASHQGAEGAALVERFAARGLVLMENCQWPFVLPALDELYPDRARGTARSLALGLGPSEAGAAMITECLSHLLSLAQAVAGITSGVGLLDAALDDPSLRADRNVLRLCLRGGPADLAAELHVQHCPEPPRPAWLAVDGARMDRHIGKGYSFTFTGNGREVPVPDPTPRLVAAFMDLVRASVPARVAVVLDEVRQRLRLYHAVLARLGL